MKESRGITPLRTILQNCLNHIENLETNRSITDNYDKEFQDLKQFSETLKTQKEFSCTEGEKEVNRKKNRYKDILPFNISRVVLSEYAGIPGSDYINANFIKGASGSPAYIASQGPLPNTVNDFWRMVVECEVQVIVMACNAQESGKHKCENYWVEKEGEEKRFGMVQICLVKASTVCPDFLVRTMRLKYTNEKDVTEERTVCQFHYSAWPDHGVPPLVRPLLDMVRLVRDTQASETLPVLVHCSAGCGRTGTICAIDFVWGLLRAGKLTSEFSLFNLVKDMRKQRVAMVQTKEQYILVHQAVRELFKEQLRVIESHPYENIDFNGVPLIKDLEEPFYDTISIGKDENCDEKQDKSEVKNKGEEGDARGVKTDSAPPLPRKKRPNVLFSKQEKEAENLTEKNRSSFVEKEKEKEKEKTDASLSSLLGKPRIVKLRAFFEKSPNAKDRTLKERGSQTVSRSHSLGAIRKPLLADTFDPQNVEKKKPSPVPSAAAPVPVPVPVSVPVPVPVPEPVKLKHSKSFSRSVPLIKRSKSLKTFSQPSQLCLSPASPVILKNYQHKPYEEERKPVEVSPNLSKECSKRRRSLESLMGDVPPSVAWQTVVDRNIGPTNRQKSLDWSPKLYSNSAMNPRASDFIKHHLQRLSLETEKKINTFVSGIGIRERRDSFRQAVAQNDPPRPKTGTDHATIVVRLKSNPTVDQPDGVSKTKSPYEKKYKLPGKPDLVFGKHSTQMTVDPRTTKRPGKARTDEPESKNLFLKKLNSEIYETLSHPQPERPRGYEDTDKASRYNPILVRSDSKKNIFRTNITVKPYVETEADVKLTEPNNEKAFQPPSRPKPAYENYKCYPASPPSTSSYNRPGPIHKTLSHQNTGNFPEAQKKVHEKEVTFCSYRKIPSASSDMYVTVGSEFEGGKLALPPKLSHGKGKTYEHSQIPWGHPGPSRSSGDVSSSEHSSDSSRVCQYEGDNVVKLEVKMMKKPEKTRIHRTGGDGGVGNSEPHSASRRPEDMKTNSADLCNYGIVGTSKSRVNSSDYSKDDFLLKEPTAPPRVKRHASVTVPRNVHNGSDHVTPWISSNESKLSGVRGVTLQVDKNAWTGGNLGVDLDAVAASMQQDKRESSSVLKDGIWSGKASSSINSNTKKKQHYL